MTRSPATRGWWPARTGAGRCRPARWRWRPPRDGRAVRAAPGQPPDAGDHVRPGHAVRHRDRAATRAGSTFWQQDTTLVRPSLEQQTTEQPAVLGGRGHRGPGPARRDPGRVRRRRARPAVGVPARRRRRGRGPGAGSLPGAEPRHHDRARADRRARARRGRAGGHLAAAAGPGAVPRHPGGRGNGAAAPVRQPVRGRHGGDPARGQDDRRAPRRRADHAARQGRIAAAGGGADAGRRGGRGRPGRADRRGPGHRGGPRRRTALSSAGWPLAGDRGRRRAGRPPADRGVAAPQARPGQQPGPDHQRRDPAARPGRGAARWPRSRRSPRRWPAWSSCTTRACRLRAVRGPGRTCTSPSRRSWSPSRSS